MSHRWTGVRCNASTMELTNEELINALFEPWEQVNDLQAKLLGAAFELACGGPAQAHVGTGGGSDNSSILTESERKRKKSGNSMSR